MIFEAGNTCNPANHLAEFVDELNGFLTICVCWLLQVFQRQMSKEGLQKVVDKEQSTDAKAQVCEPLDIAQQSAISSDSFQL
jgi:hypothetical protein